MSDELSREVERTQSESDLRAALDRALRDLDKAKAKREELVAAVYRAARDASSALVIEPVKHHHADRRTRRSEVAIAMLSDWQLGKTTPTYDSAICEQRVGLYADKVAKLAAIQRADHPVRRLHVWLLGDLVEGELIFPGQAHRIDASLFRQVTVDGPRILAGFLRKMLAEFESVHVTAVDGNHGAIGGPFRREYHPESNADRMLYQIVRDLLAGEERLTWTLTEPDGERNWYAIDRIGEYSAMLFHGDQIRGGFAGMPWYGFYKKVLGWRQVVEPFTEAACGHWHQAATLPLNEVLVRVNGSTESDNTYALEQLAAAGRPCQRLFFVSPERGRVSAEYLVWLDGDAT